MQRGISIVSNPRFLLMISFIVQQCPFHHAVNQSLSYSNVHPVMKTNHIIQLLEIYVLSLSYFSDTTVIDM